MKSNSGQNFSFPEENILPSYQTSNLSNDLMNSQNSLQTQKTKDDDIFSFFK